MTVEALYNFVLGLVENSKEGSELPTLDSLDGNQSLLVFLPGETTPYTIRKDKIIFPGEPASELIGLTDTPNSRTGQKGKILVVKEDETGFEYQVLAEVTGVSQATFNLLEQRVQDLENTSAIDHEYADIATMISNQNEQLEDDIIKVLDASADPDVPSGKAYYFYDGTIAGTIEDYTLLTSEEIKALTSQSIIDALGYTPALDSEVVKEVLDSEGNSVVTNGVAQLPEVTTKLENISALYEGSAGETIQVLGYYSNGDGGGGVFYWDATSTETANGGTILEVSGVTTGRWKRVFEGYLIPKWFGAKGDSVTDDSEAFRKTLDAISYHYPDGGEMIITSGTYYIPTTVIIPYVSGQQFYVRIVGEGAFLKGAGAGVGTIFETGQTSTSVGGVSNFDATPELYIHTKLLISGITFLECEIGIKGYNIIFNSSIENCYFSKVDTGVWLKRSFYTNLFNNTIRAGYVGRPLTATALILEDFANIINVQNTHVSGAINGTKTGIGIRIGAANGLTIRDCGIEWNDIGVYLDRDNYPVKIDSCYIEANNKGITSSGNTLDAFEVTNCFFYDNATFHVQLNAWVTGDWRNNYLASADPVDFSGATNTFNLHLGKRYVSSSSASKNLNALPSNFTVSKGVNVIRELAEYNVNIGFTAITARNLNTYSGRKTPFNYTGDPNVLNVPFCVVTNNTAASPNNFLIDTDITWGDNIGGIRFDLTVVDFNGTYNLSGTTLNNGAIYRYDNSSKIVLASNNNGKVRLTLSTFSTGTIKGKVRCL